jgi:H+/Cl- antiporter ClcA
MFAAVCGTLVFRGLRDRGALGKGFDKTSFADMDQIMHNGEIFAFALLGAICGLVGALFVHATSSLIVLVRQLRETLASHGSRRRLVGGRGGAKPLPFESLSGLGRMLRGDFSSHAALELLLSRYGYTLVVAFSSAMLTFPFGFFRSPPQEVINELFRPNRCE